MNKTLALIGSVKIETPRNLKNYNNFVHKSGKSHIDIHHPKRVGGVRTRIQFFVHERHKIKGKC